MIALSKSSRDLGRALERHFKVRQAGRKRRRPMRSAGVPRSIGKVSMALPEFRLNVILAELGKNDRVLVKDLAERFGVSRETIRRDLKELELDGQLRCTYGGAIRAQSEGDQPIDLRMKTNAKEKAAIAKRAATLVRDDTTIFIDTGTTMVAFARHLVNRDRVRVFTNSLDVVQLLMGGSVAEVCVIGGRVRPDYRATLGPLTIEALERHVFDMAFMSVAAVDYTHGFMDYGQEESALRRVLVRHTKEVVMLVDGGKFGRSAAVRTLELRQVHRLVTDVAPDAAFAATLRDAGVDIIHA